MSIARRYRLALRRAEGDDMNEFKGILDIHAHASPDPAGRRSLDVFELAKLYSDNGFRGFVFMGHFDPTAGLAWLVQKAFPALEVYGTIVLNRLVGGINSHAVRHFAEMDGGLGKIVYMPTVDCENEVKQSGNPNRPYTRISENGLLLPEVLDMLDLVSELDLALSTGHNSPAEILMLIEEGRARGIDRILVTNPQYPAISMSTEEMKKAADMGAFLEFIYYCVGMPGTKLTMTDYTDVIDEIGPEHAILSSCGGQSWMPIHTHAWRELLKGMRENGIGDDAIDIMAKRNPARLLGVKEP
jgi:hypothetical protein